MKGLFIAGRQHCGNTVLCRIFLNHDRVFGHAGESEWFEWVPVIEEAESRKEQVYAIAERLPLNGGLQVSADHLQEWSEEHPEAGVFDMFGEGMAFLARRREKQVWALKATSLIFHAQEVLDQMPDARLIYMIRNPLDLVASAYNRVLRRSREGNAIYHYGDWLYTVLLGWQKGLKIALRLRDQHPARLRIVRYEDLVREPGEVVPELFAFMNLQYQSSVLDVPHVRKSDRMSPDRSQKGLTASRINYYPDVLSPAQLHAAWSLLKNDCVQQFYPDLDREATASWRARCTAQWHKLVCGGRLLRRHVREVVREPKRGAHRIWKRITQ